MFKISVHQFTFYGWALGALLHWRHQWECHLKLLKLSLKTLKTFFKAFEFKTFKAFGMGNILGYIIQWSRFPNVVTEAATRGVL